MPSGGLMIYGGGLQLQPVTPGISNQGNAHVSGVLYSDSPSMFKSFQAGTPDNLHNLAIGDGQTWQWGGQVDDIGQMTAVGRFISIRTNPNGNNGTGGVVIGYAATVKDPSGVVIGDHTLNGATASYPTVGAYNVVIGPYASCYQILGTFDASVAIGYGSNIGAGDGSGPLHGCILIGPGTKNGTGNGRNIGIGRLISFNGGVENAICIYPNLEDVQQNITNSNSIKIGSQSHTKINIGPFDFSNGQAASGRSVLDANTTATGTDGTISYATITAARIVTLPAANAVPLGFRVLVLDASGSASAVNTITISPVGADTINGAISTIIVTPYGCREVVSDGVSKWTIIRSL